MSWNTRADLALPCHRRPTEAQISALPNDMRQYVQDLEQNVEDLNGVVRLLRQMDVFPDILATMDRLVAERQAAFEARTAPTANEPGF